MDAVAYATAVSIHAFRGEGDSDPIDAHHDASRFNPRLPGGRRPHVCPTGSCRACFNPRLPGGRRPSDGAPSPASRMFQSTPSGGKATLVPATPRPHQRVSIHAFRGEGDIFSCSRVRGVPCFNPRLPGGRRRRSSVDQVAVPCFNPRLPGGRRRSDRTPERLEAVVSIHAFRGEGDPLPDTLTTPQPSFQSTPSGGKATCVMRSVRSHLRFQSTPSGGKATAISRAAVPCSRQIL